MKIRNGFISNSSSTSFMVPACCKNEAIEYGLELISVSELKKLLNALEEIGAGYFLDYAWRYYEIKKLKDEDYITKPYDRDRAYQQGISFAAFEEDL